MQIIEVQYQRLCRRRVMHEVGHALEQPQPFRLRVQLWRFLDIGEPLTDLRDERRDLRRSGTQLAPQLRIRARARVLAERFDERPVRQRSFTLVAVAREYPRPPPPGGHAELP